MRLSRLLNCSKRAWQSNTPYEALGIEFTATNTMIKNAYHSKARIFHPDRNPDDEYAAQRFQEIQEAYKLLSNPEHKRMYDTGKLRQAGRNLGPFREFTKEELETANGYMEGASMAAVVLLTFVICDYFGGGNLFGTRDAVDTYFFRRRKGVWSCAWCAISNAPEALDCVRCGRENPTFAEHADYAGDDQAEA